MTKYSYTPIDVGFDLRLHPEIHTRIPDDATHVEFANGSIVCAGEVSTSETRRQVIKAMRAAGYQVED